MVDEHGKAVERWQAARAGHPQQPCLGRVEDCVSHQHFGASGGKVDVRRRFNVWIEPDRRGVDEEMASRRDAVCALPRRESDRPAGGFPEILHHRLAAVRRPVDHEQIGHAGHQQFRCYGAGCASGSQYGDQLSGRVHSGVPAHSPQEALPVRVLAGLAHSLNADGVNRTDRLGCRRQVVQVLQDIDLVRDRQVDSAHPERIQRRHCSPEVVGGHLEVDVAPVQAGGGEGSLLHHACRILGDGLAEDSDQFGLVVR